MKAARESTVEQYLVDQVKLLGGHIRKVKWIGRSKAPDRLVMLPGGYLFKNQSERARTPRSFLVELKAEGLAATFPNDAHERAQWREHERMRACGLDVYVIDSKAGVDEVLR